MEGLAYIGRVSNIESIEGADRIVSATVDCIDGGEWVAVIQKDSFGVGDFCEVYLQDAILKESEDYAFLAKSHWRIKIMRLRGSRSEALVLPIKEDTKSLSVGDDITELRGVIKYCKNDPATMGGNVKGNFPSFIPKTDEVNFQKMGKLLLILRFGKVHCYVTEKADGSSGTIYLKNGEFGCCSRNLDLKEDETSAVWKIALEYDLEKHLSRLPFDAAIQFEVVGPGIQGNRLRLDKIEPRLFNLYNITERRYMDAVHLFDFAAFAEIPTVEIVEHDILIPDTAEELISLSEGEYSNGGQREGIVIRPLAESEVRFRGRPSFKVINPMYKD